MGEWHLSEWAYKGRDAARAQRVYGRDAGRAVCCCADGSHREVDWVVPDVFLDEDLATIIADHQLAELARERRGWGHIHTLDEPCPVCVWEAEVDDAIANEKAAK